MEKDITKAKITKSIQALELLEEWVAENPEYDKKTWDEIKKSLKSNPFSIRKQSDE